MRWTVHVRVQGVRGEAGAVLCRTTRGRRMTGRLERATRITCCCIVAVGESGRKKEERVGEKSGERERENKLFCPLSCTKD